MSDLGAVAALAEHAASLGTVTRLVHAAGVSPNQAPPERIVAVDLLGTAYVLEAFGAVMAAGGARVVIASQAGHMGAFPPDLEQTLAYGSVEDLEAMPALADLPNSGAAYVLAKGPTRFACRRRRCPGATGARGSTASARASSSPRSPGTR